MLFQSFIALSLISLAAASPLAFNEDCDCSTAVITTTIEGSSTVMTSVAPPPTSVHSSTKGGGSWPTSVPTLTVTITETLGIPSPTTHSAPTAVGSSSDCAGTTEYTTVTVQPTASHSAPATHTSGGASDPTVSSPASGACGSAPVSCCNSVAPANSEQGRHMLSLINREHEAESFGNTLVAGGCSTGIGLLNGGTCGGTPVCCNSAPGLISIGCISLML